jgi:hypothetical protein
MADNRIELDDLFVEELRPRATPISTVVATECCGTCNSGCEPTGDAPRPLENDIQAEAEATAKAEDSHQ